MTTVTKYLVYETCEFDWGHSKQLVGWFITREKALERIEDLKIAEIHAAESGRSRYNIRYELYIQEKER